MGLHLYSPCDLFMMYIYLVKSSSMGKPRDLSCQIQLLKYPIPLFSVLLSNIFGTKKGIIDPLVSKRPGNKSEKKKIFLFSKK